MHFNIFIVSMYRILLLAYLLKKVLILDYNSPKFNEIL